MTRFLTEGENVYVPPQWRTDTSVARDFLAVAGDPARSGSGVVVVDGDTWLNCPRDTSPVPPPPPPPPPPPGTYKPGASTLGPAFGGYNPNVTYPTTGGPAGNVVNGFLTLLDSGIDLKNYIFNCYIDDKGVGNRIRGSILHGGPPVTSGNDVALYNCTASTHRDSIIEFCEFDPTYPTAWVNGIRGHGFIERYNDIHGVCDGIDFIPSGGAVNAYRVASSIHDLAGFGPDSIGRAFVHADCMQWVGGSGVTIQGCADYGFFDPTIGQATTTVNPNYPYLQTNTVLQVTQPSGPARGLSYTDSWIYGGSASLNLAITGGTTGDLGTIARNRFGHDQYYQGGAAANNGIDAGRNTTVTWLNSAGYTFDDESDNRYEDNLVLITKR
jgi:hypothetical protein